MEKFFQSLAVGAQRSQGKIALGITVILPVVLILFIFLATKWKEKQNKGPEEQRINKSQAPGSCISNFLHLKPTFVLDFKKGEKTKKWNV